MDGSNVDARGASSVICGLCVNVCVNVRVCVCVCESFDAALQQPEPLRDAWFADVQVGPRGTTTRIAGAGIWIREREKKLATQMFFAMPGGCCHANTRKDPSSRCGL